MTFLKKHLLGIYDWTVETEQSLFEGEATRRLFNRWNGSQVLFVINIFLLNTNDPSVENGRKAEWLLLEKLPSGAKSEISVLQWLFEQKLDVAI